MYYSEEKEREYSLSEQLRNVKKGSVLITYDKNIEQILDKEIENLFPKKPSWSYYVYDTKVELVEQKLPANLYNYEWLSYFILNKLRDKHIDMRVSDIISYLKNSKKFKNLRANYEKDLIRDYIFTKKKINSMTNKTTKSKDFKNDVMLTFSLIHFNPEMVGQFLEENQHLWKSKESLIQKSISDVKPVVNKQVNTSELALNI